jgi:hypothetical protein
MKNWRNKRKIEKPSAVLFLFLLFPTIPLSFGQTKTGAKVP